MSQTKFYSKFRVEPDTKVNLKDYDPDYSESAKGDKHAEEEIKFYSKRLRELQNTLYANRTDSLLICLQAPDAGGKDGTIDHVLGSMNPQGCRVVSFKQPSELERSHDFLWRVHLATPQSGEVVIFNRSHYEDVLVVRVHDLVPKNIWEPRYQLINSFEKGLVEHKTHILKFFLHISKEEQLSRFKDRLKDPSKNWKISESDYSERKCWDSYVRAYEDAFSRCSTKEAPWFIIPSDHKWFRNLAIAKIVVGHLESLDLSYPSPTVDIDQIKREYHAAAKSE
jgi:PPK2 family polyphosphate:nucleotide phosphotransferase